VNWYGLVGISAAGAVALTAAMVVSICQAAKKGDERPLTEADHLIMWEREQQVELDERLDRLSEILNYERKRPLP
jgi:hypothetical protein